MAKAIALVFAFVLGMALGFQLAYQGNEKPCEPVDCSADEMVNKVLRTALEKSLEQNRKIYGMLKKCYGVEKP